MKTIIEPEGIDLSGGFSITGIRLGGGDVFTLPSPVVVAAGEIWALAETTGGVARVIASGPIHTWVVSASA